MAKLKPWFHVVQPRDDLRSGKPLDASEFAVHLDHVREGRAPEVYIKPQLFFERTYLTKTLLDLSAQVVRRLSGIRVETSSTFNLATQFGGGKTHSLTLLYHLAKAGPAANYWQGVPHILSRAEVTSVPRAATAIFVGTEFDSLVGRGGDDGSPRRRTPWGEIAFQLGGEAAFEKVREHDAQGRAPAGDVIRSFLPDGPALILLDELMNYISCSRKDGMAAQTYNFLQNLTEEASARENLVLVVSIPGSDLEMNVEDQRDYESLKKMLDRKGKPMLMSADTETSEIIRRRLFEWGGLPEEGRMAANEYADWALEHKESLGDVDAETIRERFQAAYPFHPAVLSVFESKWQALPRFQRTRGTLRLLALWVSKAYAAGYRGAHRDPLIGLGTAPLDDPYFRIAMFEQLGSEALEGPVTSDIAGMKEAHAQRLDREAQNEDVRKARLHQKVATAVLFESNGGMTRAEATLPEVRFAVGEPDMAIGNVETVLETLVEKCHYLTSEHNRYRLSVTPNLNKVLTDRKASVQELAIDERARQEIQSVFKAGQAGLTRVYFPEKSTDVPNRPALTLVVLDPDRTQDDPDTAKFVEGLVKDYGTAGRTYKSALIFAVAKDPTPLYDATRTLLAYEDIASDDDTLRRLDEAQARQLKEGKERAPRAIKEAVWKTYGALMLLGKDNQLKVIDLGPVNSSMASSMVELIVNQLRLEDEITEAVGVHKLVKYWPPAITAWSTKAVRDAFYSSPALPRLMDSLAIRRTIADGVLQKAIAYVGQDADGGYKPLYFGASLTEADIEISDEMFILTAAEAVKHIEPLRLARVEIVGGSLRLKPGGETSFSVRGYDQHGRPFAVENPVWSASDGTVDDEGRFAAPQEPGTCVVTVKAVEVSAQVQVQVAEAVSPPAVTVGGVEQPQLPLPPVDTPVSSTVRWEGEVPWQKWTNLYMKVITKVQSEPGLKLRATIEVPSGGTISEAKLQEIRMALRELGLTDDLEKL